MAPAGDAHVVVFVVCDARRALGLVRDERGDRRRMRGLALFAAEAAAHPLRDHGDLVDRQSEQMGDDFLHFGRILRR